MKAVIYARVSTEKQNNQNQVDTLCQWAEHRGYTLLEIYQENETAWKNGHQKELQRLITAEQRGQFKVVLV